MTQAHTSPKAAFVAGATGYTGREVVRALVARGVMTTAHVRPDSSRIDDLRRELEADGALVNTSPWDAAAMRSALSATRPDLVFALLGTTRKRGQMARAGGTSESYESVDYGLTALLLRAAVEAAGEEAGAPGAPPVPRFVYLSALGAGRPSSSAYYAARFKVETEIVASGLPYVIARPSFITGPDRAEPRAGERIAAAVVDGALGWMGRLGARALHDRFGSMTARELALALVTLGLTTAGVAVIAETPDLRASVVAALSVDKVASGK